MAKVQLTLRKDGKPSVTLKKHGALRVRIVNAAARPHKPGSQSAQAWEALAQMNGMTVAEVHMELRRREPQIQGKVGRPLGWLVDAIHLGNVELVDDALE